MEDANDPLIIARHVRNMRKSCDVTGHDGLAKMCLSAAETIERLAAPVARDIVCAAITCARDKESGLYHATTGERDYLTADPTEAMDRSALLFERDANPWGDKAELVEFTMIARPTGRTSKDLYKDGKLNPAPPLEDDA